MPPPRRLNCAFQSLKTFNGISSKASAAEACPPKGLLGVANDKTLRVASPLRTAASPHFAAIAVAVSRKSSRGRSSVLVARVGINVSGSVIVDAADCVHERQPTSPSRCPLHRHFKTQSQIVVDGRGMCFALGAGLDIVSLNVGVTRILGCLGKACPTSRFNIIYICRLEIQNTFGTFPSHRVSHWCDLQGTKNDTAAAHRHMSTPI
ncbi:hypothetical protein C8J57DRAFT_1252794 [Mycena rebaudengoi]|nr:hypothetical protein C8J57DRAFT_1252794 [Mycena rebaudengoi]